jgi:acetyl-CoA acyltransferase
VEGDAARRRTRSRWSRTSGLAAQQAGEFADEMTPVEVTERSPNLATGESR